MKKILVTGSSGYIGGTFTYEALKKGHTVLGIDNYINSEEHITKTFQQKFNNFSFKKLDLSTNRSDLEDLISIFSPDVIAHFAGLKAVGESEDKPELYWKNNVESTKNILEACKPRTRIIFSSSATVYGESKVQPINEVVQSNQNLSMAAQRLPQSF